MFRTDENNNPAAFTTDIAQEAGLTLNVDYILGEPFEAPSHLVTAKLLGDPIAITRRVISTLGYYTRAGQARWAYISMPKYVWNALTPNQQRDVIGFHYQHEGGTAMKNLFPNYGEL